MNGVPTPCRKKTLVPTVPRSVPQNREGGTRRFPDLVPNAVLGSLFPPIGGTGNGIGVPSP